MKTIYVLLAAALFVVTNASNKQWGNITENTERKRQARFFIRHPVDENSTVSETYTFPHHDWQNVRSITVDGIKVVDNSPVSANVTILNGGIGQPFVTINILSSPGHFISVLIQFFVSSRAIDNIPKVLNQYFEAKFDVGPETPD